MMHRAHRSPLVVKEFRALALPFMACLAAMLGSALMGGVFHGLPLLAYCIGAPALGALSIGHEYLNHTLPMLLAQPVDRRRVLATKLGVAATLLLATAAIAAFSIFHKTLALEFSTGPMRTAAIFLPVLCGLTLAPYLTMTCRSALAGVIFAMTIPGTFIPVADLIGIKLLGVQDIYAFRFTFFVTGTLIGCAFGAVMTWRTFMRLEANDGPVTEIHLSISRRADQGSATPEERTANCDLRTASSEQRHPMWLLTKKEVRLQPMAFALAGLYVVGWVVACVLPRYTHSIEVFHVMTLFYSASVALLIGSHASAEERQFGTLPSQLLLPVAASTQWAVKAAVALALSWLLTIALPALLWVLTPVSSVDVPRAMDRIWLTMLVTILVSTVGLYVSSLSTSGLRALLTSLIALVGLGWFLNLTIASLGTTVQHGLIRLLRWPSPWPAAVARIDLRVLDGLSVALAIGLLLIVLRFALANHRSADRGSGRVLGQVLWMAGGLVLCVALLAGAAAL